MDVDDAEDAVLDADNVLDVATVLDVVDVELAEENPERLAGPRLLDGVRELERSWDSVWPVLRARNLLEIYAPNKSFLVLFKIGIYEKL